MQYTPFPQIVGPTYTLASLNAACQRCVNMMVEGIEGDPTGNNFYLRETPGTLEFCNLPIGADILPGINQIFVSGKGRVFCSAGNVVFELFEDGTYEALLIINDYTTALTRFRFSETLAGIFLIPEPTRVVGVYTPMLYFIPYDAAIVSFIAPYGAVGMLPAGFLGASFLVSLDNYLITIVMDASTGLLTNQFQISPNPYAGYIVPAGTPVAWDAAKVFSAETNSDPINGLIVNGRELWVFGASSYEVWYNPGITISSFERIRDAAYPIGCAAPWSLQSFQGSVYWLGSSKEGYGIVWQSQGLQAKRISTTPIERLIQGITDITDAVSWVYQGPGHSCYVLSFPSGKATYAFDLQTGIWHELSFRDLDANIDYQHLGTCSAFAFNKTLISDFRNYKILEYKFGQYSDSGDPIIRYRRAPVVNAGQRRISYHKLEFNMQVGVGSGQALPGVFANYDEHWTSANINWDYTGDYSFFQGQLFPTIDGSAAFAEFTPGVDTMAYPIVTGDYLVNINNLFNTRCFTPGANTALNSVYFSVDNTFTQDYVIAILSYLGGTSDDYFLEIYGEKGGVPFDDLYNLGGALAGERDFEVDFAISATGFTCTVDNVLIANSAGFDFPEIGFIMVDAQRTTSDRRGAVKNTIISSTNPGPLLYGTDFDPVMSVRWSDDNGYTWGNYHTVKLGKLGEYKDTVQFNRLGSAKYRVFEVYCDAAIPLRIISAELGIEVWKH